MDKVQLQPILTEAEYQRALARLYALFDSEPGTPQGDELAALADVVAAYEDIHCPIPDPPPGAFIEYELERLALTPEALIPAIGSRETVAAVLAGQQEVTPAMADALYELLDIDVRDLLPQAAGVAGS